MTEKLEESWKKETIFLNYQILIKIVKKNLSVLMLFLSSCLCDSRDSQLYLLLEISCTWVLWSKQTVPGYICGAQSQRNLQEMMPGCLREQQWQQRHLLAKMGAGTYTQSVQHLLTHLSYATNLEKHINMFLAFQPCFTVTPQHVCKPLYCILLRTSQLTFI